MNIWAAYSNQIVDFTYDISGNILDRAMNIPLGDNIIANASDFESASSSPYDKGDGDLSGFFPQSTSTNIVNAYTVSSNVTKDIIGTTRPTASGAADYGAFEIDGVAPTTYTLTVNANNGTVSKSPNKVNYNEDEVVTLTASLVAGYKFDNWSGDA